MSKKTIIKGPKIYTEQGIIEHGSLFVENGIIKDIVKNSSKDLNPSEILSFPSDYCIIPGMIDIHIHGTKGSDIMDGSVGAIETIVRSLPSEGTTSFLATTITESIDRIDKALKSINEYINSKKEKKGAQILGIHMEGPFLSQKRKGAQRGDHVIPSDKELFTKWQKLSGNRIKIVTIAPEGEGALDFIGYLKQEGIIASLGHSDATYEETLKAIEAGARHGTHLFNAMRGISQRDPGIAGALLSDQRITVELIIDRIHLHNDIVKMVLKNKGTDKIILVTDSIRAKGLGDGVYDLGGLKVNVKKCEARLPDGTLAGSVLKMCEAAKYIMSDAGIKIEDIIKITSKNQAKALGIYDHKGGIAKGKDADLVVLDNNFNVVLTICMGEVAYKKEGKDEA